MTRPTLAERLREHAVRRVSVRNVGGEPRREHQ